MAVALIADAHLGGSGGSAGELVRQLDEVAARGCERLVLMGDLFHVWVGSRRFETEAIGAVVSKLSELRKRGLRIEYIEGNRDFFLADSVYAEAFSSVGTETSFVVGGCRYLAVHGDGLNDRDRQYLFWRWLSKSRLSRWLVFHLPTPIARWALETTEAGLAQTNFKHRSGLPEEAVSRYAERRLAAGFDVLLLGHFHMPCSWPVEGGEVRTLDAWFNTRSVEWIEETPATPRMSDP